MGGTALVQTSFQLLMSFTFTTTRVYISLLCLFVSSIAFVDAQDYAAVSIIAGTVTVPGVASAFTTAGFINWSPGIASTW